MEKFKGLLLMVLLVISVCASHSHVPLLASAATPLSILPVPNQQRHSKSKILATLGLVCECCDGKRGECSSTWTRPCSQLKCLPWKQH